MAKTKQLFGATGPKFIICDGQYDDSIDFEASGLPFDPTLYTTALTATNVGDALIELESLIGFGVYLPLAGGTMSGAIEMNENELYFDTTTDAYILYDNGNSELSIFNLNASGTIKLFSSEISLEASTGGGININNFTIDLNVDTGGVVTTDGTIQFYPDVLGPSTQTLKWIQRGAPDFSGDLQIDVLSADQIWTLPDYTGMIVLDEGVSLTMNYTNDFIIYANQFLVTTIDTIDLVSANVINVSSDNILRLQTQLGNMLIESKTYMNINTGDNSTLGGLDINSYGGVSINTLNSIGPANITLNSHYGGIALLGTTSIELDADNFVRLVSNEIFLYSTDFINIDAIGDLVLTSTTGDITIDSENNVIINAGSNVNTGGLEVRTWGAISILNNSSTDPNIDIQSSYGGISITAVGGMDIVTLGQLRIDGNINIGYASGTSLLGFWGAPEVTKQNLLAYTTDVENVIYTGIDNTQVGAVYAQLTDVNALRVAYENLRVAYEDLRTKLITTTFIGVAP